jgi:DegV family protein with EDD domain
MAYKLITDITTDLSVNIAETLDFEMIPMPLEIDGVFGDSKSQIISSEQFYDLLSNGAKVSTSQINPITYKACFEKYLKQGLDILYIGFSSGLSGSINNSVLMANELMTEYPERKIICIDSLSASSGEGLLVYTAALHKNNGMSIQDLSDWVIQNRLKICSIFTVEDLRFLHKGGRISASSAVLGTMVNVKPLLSVRENGTLYSYAKVRGYKKAISTMASHMIKRWNPSLGHQVFISHANCVEYAKHLGALIQTHDERVEIHLHDLGPVIGTHTGPGTIALFFWGDERDLKLPFSV